MPGLFNGYSHTQIVQWRQPA